MIDYRIHRRRRLAAMTLSALLLAATGGAWKATVAQAAAPQQPLTLIVPYGPGGTGDVIARLVAESLAGDFPAGIIVDNKPGAAGSIGAAAATRAAPDGNTVLLAYTSEIVINPVVQPKLTYEASSFEPVAFAGSTPLLLVTNPKVPAKNLDELVALGKRSDKPLSYASAGLGSPAYIAGALLARLGHIELLHVPYKGGSPAVVDTVAGNVDMYFSGMPPAVPFVKSGKLNALGVASAQPSPALPEVPALAKDDYRELDLAGWFGFFVPKGVPAGVRDQLNGAFNKALQSDKVKDKLRSLGVETQAMTPEQFGSFVRAEQKKYASLIAELGITVGQ